MRRAGLALPLVLLAAPAFAQPSAVQVSQAWARAPASDGTVPVYMTLYDSGGPDRLTSVTTDAANIAVLDQSRDVSGVAQARALNNVELPAGGTVVMRPGGLQVTLMDLNR